jgi:hypothetical protein
MKKLIFLLALILCFSLSAKPQKQQTVNVFYGYPLYALGKKNIIYPYNYSFGIQYGFALNEKFKLDIGCSFNTRDYFYVEYPHDPYNGTTKLTLETHINVLKLPIFHLSYNLFELNQRNKISVFSGIEFLNITNAYQSYTLETLIGEILWEFKDDLENRDYKQTGVNTLLGLSYYCTIFQRLQFRVDFCLLFKLKDDTASNGSVGIKLDHPRILFEPKFGIGFINK